MRKVYINWYYADNASLHDPQVWECMENSLKNITWQRVHNTEDADLYITCDNLDIPRNCRGQKVLWLYEPKVILPHIHDTIQNNKTGFDYIFTSEHNAVSAQNNIRFIHPSLPSFIMKKDQMIYEKTKGISMIASKKNMSNGHQYRNVVADMVGSYGVDLFGRGRERPLGSKVDGLKDYRFSIQIENCVSEGYFTEKILDCFLTGTVPIYWGSNSVDGLFNPRGIIRLDTFLEQMKRGTFDPIKEYESRKVIIEENFRIALDNNKSFFDGVNEICNQLTK